MNIDFESFKTLLTVEHQPFVNTPQPAEAQKWKAALKSFERTIEENLSPYGLTVTSSWSHGIQFVELNLNI